MLQKPLLTLFLALFHLVKFGDITHLVLVKLLFAALGTYGFFIYVKLLFKVTNFSFENKIAMNLTAFIFALASPTYLNYFSGVRSDQVACVLFAIFLYLCEQRKMLPALVSLIAIPLFGIKEILFLAPGLLYLFWMFKENFIKGELTKKHLLWAAVSSFAVLIWLINFNLSSFDYFINSYENTHYAERFSTYYYKDEMLFLILSLLASIWIFVSKKREFYRFSLISIFFLIVLLAMPQSFYFLMASLIPFIYLPVLALLLTGKRNWFKMGVVAFQIIFIISTRTSGFLVPVFNQYRFISVASKLIKENHFTYLDGIGTMPEQKFYPCFVSPFDELANNGCVATDEHPPDVIIITNRLATTLGDTMFNKAQKNYTQIYPNLWVLNSSLTQDITDSSNLTFDNLPLPVFIF